MSTLTKAERAVWREFRQAPYQAHGSCASCGTNDIICGRAPRSRICIHCYEFVFNSRFPSTRRLEGRA